ncbi:MAG: PAS domain S-box protein [Bacteroidota bacterium]
MAFDIKTIFTLFFFADIFIALVFFLHKILIKYNADKLNIYIAAKLLQAVSILFYAILREDIPTTILIVLGNIPAFFGIALEAYAFSSFGYKKSRMKLPVFLAIASIFSVIFLLNIKSELHVRVFIAFIIYSVLFISAGINLLKVKPKKRAKVASGIFLLFISAMTLYRSIDAWLMSEHIQLFHQQVSEILVFLSYFVISFILAINYIFLLKEEDENTIINSNKLFNDILHSFPGEVYVVEPDYSVQYSNMQKSKVNTNGNKKVYCYEEKHGKTEKCKWCVLNNLSKDNRLIKDEYFDKNTKKYYRTNHILLHNKNILTVRKDITEEKYTQQRIKMLSDIVEQSADSIVVTNLEGTLEYVNKAFTNITGYTYNEVIGQNPRVLQSKLVNEEVYQDLWDHVTNGKIWKGEFVNKKKNGELYNESAVIAPTFDASGNIVNYFGIKQDITDKKISEKLLAESEKRYRTIFEESANPVLLIKKGCFVDCNKATLDILKINSKEDFVNISPSEISPKYQPDGRLSGEKGTEMINRALKTGSYSFEWVHKNILNKNIWLAVSLTKISIKGDTYLYVEWRDITKNKTAEKALKESEEKYRTLVETASDWIWEIDKNGRYTYSSPQVYSILGYTSKEIIGKTPFDLMPDKERNTVSKVFNNIIKQNEPIVKVENTNVHKNGNLVVLETSGVPFFDPDNNLLGYRGIDRDVTDKKTAEKTLEENEQLLNKLFGINPIPVGVLDFKTLKYVRINKIYTDSFGYSPEELIGKTPSELGIISNDQQMELYRLLGEKGSLENIDVKLKNKQGKELDTILFVEMIEEQGKKLIYTTFIDISEKNAAKEALQIANNKLKDALEDKEVLLKEVHHRVKNNMQTIHSLLFKQQRISDNNLVKLALQDSMDRISSMALINEHIYRNKNFKEINFGKHLTEFTKRLISAYQEPGKKIELKIHAEAVYLSIDKAMPCTLIVSEIVSNSLKYAFSSRDNGIISIELANLNNTHVYLSISDNGIGLPENFDSENTNSLGMFIITNLSKRQLKGELEMNSENGTHFIIKFRK